MTVAEIDSRIKAMREIAHDTEAVHGEMDSLWHDVLVAIAGGQRGARALAEAALGAAHIGDRWYA